MLYFPQSKINLGINITSKRPDGYHNIETLFYPIALTDSLELTEANETSLTSNGLKIEGSTDNNLVLRALRLMQTEYGVPDIQIRLDKRIPMGAGLGGGSSDAAATLRMLNSMYSLGCTDNDLCRLAVKLGADCPFFIHSRPMYATGIGEILTPADIDLSSYHLVLIKPDIHISTADAYANCTPRAWSTPLTEVIAKPIDEWKDFLLNDFETTVFAKHPILAEIKASLYRLGARYASMSGSGSTIYGIFNTIPDRTTVDTAISDITQSIQFMAYYL